MCANDTQNRAQMKESKCAKDILKCANEKRRSDEPVQSFLSLETPNDVQSVA